MQPDNSQQSVNTGVPSGVAPGQQPVYNQPYNTSSPVQAYSAAGLSMAPQIAEDHDLIEEEWVSAAKHIIAENKHDPFMQNQAMNLLRKDYMKKRYGEDIKTAN